MDIPFHSQLLINTHSGPNSRICLQKQSCLTGHRLNTYFFDMSLINNLTSFAIQFSRSSLPRLLPTPSRVLLSSSSPKNPSFQHGGSLETPCHPKTPISYPYQTPHHPLSNHQCRNHNNGGTYTSQVVGPSQGGSTALWDPRLTPNNYFKRDLTS